MRFQVLEPGPIGQDELRGDVDLFEAHNLGRIAQAVLGGAIRHGDYFKGLSAAAELRKGPGMGLTPLGENPRDPDGAQLEPLDGQLLRRGLRNFRPGSTRLSEADLGLPVANGIGRVGAPAGSEATRGSGGVKRKKMTKRRASTAGSEGA